MLEEGIAGVREIDLGMMLGTGMVPGPFARADARGLDEVLAALERAEAGVGRALRAAAHAAPAGRAGPARRQERPGLLPLSAAGARLRAGARQARPARRRRRVAVARQPARELALPGRRSRRSSAPGARSTGRPRAVVIASPNPALFCAGADIKAFTTDGRGGGRDLLARVHALGRAMERSRTMTIAAVNGAGARRRLRAGDGLRRPPRGLLGLLRPARDQPRDHPGLRRHAAAAAARRAGQGARDEHDRRPDLRRGGLRVRARQPRRGGPRAVRHGDGVGTQDRAPGAARARADQARVGTPATSTRASPPRSEAFADGLRLARTRARASPPSSASARRGSRARERGRGRPPARRAGPLGAARRGAHRARGSPSRPGSRTSARPAPGCGRTWTRWRSPTSTSWRRDPERFWAFYGSASRSCAASGPTARTARWSELERARPARRRRSRRTSTACTARRARAS